VLNAIGKLAIGVGVLAVGSTAAMYNVDGGERALIFDRFQGGITEQVIGEGTHFFIPWVQQPIVMDVRTNWMKIQADTGTKDMQTVAITLRILYRPEIRWLPTIFRTLGRDYADRILPSLGNEILTATVAQYDAVELITQREQVSQQIRETLIERMSRYHIALDDVSITHLTFSPEYAGAIERKQVAQQEAERSKFLVDKERQLALANTIRAEGEAEAARLITRATGPGFIQLRRLEAAREIAETLAHSRNIVYLPQGTCSYREYVPCVPTRSQFRRRQLPSHTHTRERPTLTPLTAALLFFEQSTTEKKL
jgi:prohibitin 1